MADRRSRLKREPNTPLTPIKGLKSVKKDQVDTTQLQKKNKMGRDEVESTKKDGKSENNNEDILSMFRELKEGQQAMKQSFESRFENLQRSITEQINSKFNELKDEFQIDIARLDKKFEEMELRIKGVHNKVEEVKMSQEPLKNFDPEKTIVVSGLKHDAFETQDILDTKIQSLVSEIKESPPPGGDRELQEATVVRSMRLKPRDNNAGRSPIVKVEFRTKDEKVAILRGKQVLKESRTFKKVFIRTSKSHEARMMEQNLQNILEYIGADKDLKIASNGKLIPKPPATNAWARGQDGQRGGGNRYGGNRYGPGIGDRRDNQDMDTGAVGGRDNNN